MIYLNQICFASYSDKYFFEAVTIVSPMLGVNGWPFSSVDPFPGAEIDPLYNSEHVKDLYLRADPNYSARYVSFYATPLIRDSIQFVCTGPVFLYCGTRKSTP